MNREQIYEEKVHVWNDNKGLQEELDNGWSAKLGVAQSTRHSYSHGVLATETGDVIFILRRPKQPTIKPQEL